MNFLEAIHGQFALKNFFFYHKNPEDFVKSQWQLNEKCLAWLIWRWICAIFFALGVIASILRGWHDGKWLIYLTDWGFLLITITNCISAIMSTVYYCTLKTQKHITMFFWLLYHTNAVLAFFISLIYWSLIFPHKTSAITSYINWWSHATNSIITIIDVFLSAHPIRLLHFIYPVFFGIIYDIFLIIYYLLDGTDPDGNPYVYIIMDFRNPKKAIIYQVLCILVLAFLTVFLQFLYMLRIYIYSKTKASKKTKPPAPTINSNKNKPIDKSYNKDNYTLSIA